MYNRELIDFQVRTTGEPHRARRRTILKKYPEVKKLFGYDSTTAYITYGLVTAQLAIAFLMQAQPHPILGTWWMFGIVAYVFGGTLNHWCAMCIHEAAHNLVASTPLRNRIVALIANIPSILPGSMTFIRHHMGHHTYMGVEGRDNDLPSRPELRWVQNSRMRKFIWQSLFLLVQGGFRGIMRKPNKWEVVNLCTQTLVAIGIYQFMGGVAVGYLLLSTFFAFGLHPVAGHYIHEHFLFKDGQETYSYYGLLNKVTFNVGYHYEHHDIVNIPGPRLPEYHRITAEFYDGLQSHNSWVEIMWRFITHAKFGTFSRYTRSLDTFKAAARGNVKSANA